MSLSIKKIKLVMLGDSGVGKSCIISRLVYKFFNEYISATIGAQFLTKDYLDEGLRIDIWDTAGQERFRSLIPMYLRGAHILAVVLDCTHDESKQIEQRDFWLNYINTNMTGTNYKKVLIYNKTDLSPNFKVENDTEFDATIATSCKMNTGLDIFEKSVKELAGEIDPSYVRKNKNIVLKPAPTYLEMVSDMMSSNGRQCSIL